MKINTCKDKQKQYIENLKYKIWLSEMSITYYQDFLRDQEDALEKMRNRLEMKGLTLEEGKKWSQKIDEQIFAIKGGRDRKGEIVKGTKDIINDLAAELRLAEYYLRKAKEK